MAYGNANGQRSYPNMSSSFMRAHPLPKPFLVHQMPPARRVRSLTSLYVDHFPSSYSIPQTRLTLVKLHCPGAFPDELGRLQRPFSSCLLRIHVRGNARS
ncbi:hypothetical protein TRVL_04042 [Trypanosoma vivax]|nr:hypothetical protein TRVL_04042 [Trypanosoma vivax]